MIPFKWWRIFKFGIGSFCGKLSSVKACELGSVVIQEALKRCSIDPNNVSEVIMGQVILLQALTNIFVRSHGYDITSHKICNQKIECIHFHTMFHRSSLHSKDKILPVKQLAMPGYRLPFQRIQLIWYVGLDWSKTSKNLIQMSSSS